MSLIFRRFQTARSAPSPRSNSLRYLRGEHYKTGNVELYSSVNPVPHNSYLTWFDCDLQSKTVCAAVL